MTPLQADKQHCANWNCGACLGMYYNEDGSVDWSRYRPRDKCVLHNSREACPYFEEIVLPQVDKSVAEEYRKSLPAQVTTGVRHQRLIKRFCIECRNREVGPRQKYCPVCAKIRQRESKRRSIREKRSLNVDKLVNSRLRAEALTNAVQTSRYIDPAGAELVINP
jgi:hypothetical protein